MNTASIAGWALVGFVAGASMRMLVRHFSFPPVTKPRLAPPGVLEVTTAVLFAAMAWRIGAHPDLFAYSWLAAVGVPLATIDWSTRELPTRLIWPSAAVLAALFGVAAVVNHDVDPLIRAAAGLLVLLAFYGAIYFLRPGQLGGGDVRLGGLLGLALGWTNWLALLTGTLSGWLAAAIAVLTVRVVRRSARGFDVPLGPFLIFGAFVAILANAPM